MTDTQEARPPDTRPLFRPEAIEAHARGRGVEDEGLELKEERTAWAFRLLLVLLVLAIAVGLTVKIEETAKGRASVTQGTAATVDLPVGAAPRLREGQLVRLGKAKGTVTKVLAPTSRENGVPVVPVLVAFDRSPDDGEATVRLSRRTLAELLLGRGDA